jgi:nitroreductase
MDLKEVIEKRRTVRDFKNKEVPRQIIEYAIENGFKAPTYNHVHELYFIIIHSLESKLDLIKAENLDRKIDIQELEKLLEKEELYKKEMYLNAIPKQKRMILDAPSVIIVIFKPKISVVKAKRIYDLNCLASAWAGIENFLLSLAEHDVYGVTYVPKNIDTIKKNLGIPDELEIASVIPIGYKADDSKVLKQKSIAVAERIHIEKW